MPAQAGELLWQALSGTATRGTATERAEAAAFFVNQGTPVTLDEDERRLVVDGADQVPIAWFDRVNRFVRLARRTGLSFTDLDLVLRTCCGNRIDLAFAALWWVPLCPPSVAEGLGFHDSKDRPRRLHLMLDAYGYDGDRHAFGTAIVQRARRQVTVMREMAEAGDRAAIALLPIAGYIEQSASDVEALPDDFWVG